MVGCSAICVVIITIFLPPLGVFLISGCSIDFFINILLTILGYFPGHVHAFYLEYIYYHRRSVMAAGNATVAKPAPGVYSEHIQTGGRHQENQYETQYNPQYGTI